MGCRSGRAGTAPPGRARREIRCASAVARATEVPRTASTCPPSRPSGRRGKAGRCHDGSARLVYEMDYELTGLLRFAGGLLGPQYAEGIRRNMQSLKRYVESGKGPKPKK